LAIATLMGVCLIFVLLGWTGHAYTAAALSIGTIVAIAASNAGTTSQDLKTSFLVGGTPWRPAGGPASSGGDGVVVIGGTLQLINKANQRVQEAGLHRDRRPASRRGHGTGTGRCDLRRGSRRRD